MQYNSFGGCGKSQPTACQLPHSRVSAAVAGGKSKADRRRFGSGKFCRLQPPLPRSSQRRTAYPMFTGLLSTVTSEKYLGVYIHQDLK